MSELSGLGSDAEVVAPAEVSPETTPVAAPTEAETQVEGAPAAPTYTVKVDGVDQAVTIEDLQKGYMLQGDYTRKTQALAAQRQQLAQAEALQAALERDPAGTLKALQEAFGIQTEPVEDFSTPEEKRFRQLETFQAQQEAVARQAQIDRDLGRLHQQYGDFDDNEVFVYAIKNNSPDLVSAYKAMTYDNVRSEALAARAAQEAKVEAETIEAKRLQAGVVHQGQGAQAGAVGEVQTKPNSIKEALASALKAHGFASMPRA